jgi:outer membrane protein OmpA-like peptidoglycan-associated protein
MPSSPAHSQRAASSTMIRLLPIVFIAGLAACSGTVSRYGSGVSSTNARSAQGAPGDVPAAAPVKKAVAPAAPVQTEAIPASASTASAVGRDHAASTTTTDSSKNVQSPPESSAKIDESGAAAGGAVAATEAIDSKGTSGNPDGTAAVSESGTSDSGAHADSAAGESAQHDTQAVAAAVDASGANLQPEAGATTESGGGAADAASGQGAAAASAGSDNAGSMGASGESATAGASESAKVAAISSDSLGDGGVKLSGATGEGTDGLKAGAVAGAEAADASRQGDQPAAKQGTVVGLVDVPGKKATVKEDRIPQTLGGMLPMTLGVDGEGEFDFDKAVVRPEVKAVLDKLAAKLKDSEYDTLDIVGHADRLGTEEYNQSLSERRAWAVARYLIAQGVPLKKIRVEGHGVSEPLSKPEDCAGLSKKDAIVCLQKDRRVEIAASIRNTEVKVQ